jgi:putative NADH-flavin reductase
MQLTVFGATGGTGIEIVRQALADGQHVTAVARRPEAVTARHANLTVCQGDVLDPEWAGTGVAGADAVLSALGARERGPPTVYSAGLVAILGAMAAAGVSRLVTVTAVPASPAPEKTLADRWVMHPILHAFFGPAYADMRAMEEVLARSPADWTVFRPPRLTNGPAGKYRTAAGRPLARAWTISRASLAGAMLAAVGDPEFSRRAVTIAQ